jgi:hypothetical protein
VSVATLPEVAEPACDTSDVDHIFCCDPDVALCGEDIAGGTEHYGECTHPMCPLCEALEEYPCPRCGQ